MGLSTRSSADSFCFMCPSHVSAPVSTSPSIVREAEEAFHHSRAWHAAFTAIRHGHVPVVAALHGATVGGGLELAAACHIRLADTTAFSPCRRACADLCRRRRVGSCRAAAGGGQRGSEADGLFVESLMAALSQSGAEAAARLADFVGKRGAKVRPPSESSLAVSQGAASGVAAAADID
jgi:hypothetical protein